MNCSRLLVGACVAVFGCLFAHADTWYADAAHYNTPGMDGTSPETAFGTIQEAVDKAKADDTVLVAEGVYDKGAPTCAPGAMDARVSITNKITVKASGAKEKTVIVGRHASTLSGVGEDAIRCVYIDAACSGVVVRGFTIRDGGVRQSDITAAGCSGGVYAGTHYSLGDLIVDCDIVNCAGSRGGAVKGGVSVRCRYFGSRCDYTGAIGRDSAFWNCLFVANGKNSNLFEGCRLVNCSVIGNATSVFSSNSYALNTICAGNGGINCRSDMKTCKGSVFALPNEAGAKDAGGMENVVCDSRAAGAVIAPLFGDFRVVKGHPAETSGRLAYMTLADIHSYIPADERYIDLNGNPIVENDGSICAGALQETAARAATGGGIVGAGVGKWTVCGVPTTTDTLWAFPAEYPTFMKIDCFKGTDIVAFAYGSAFNDYRQPLMDGTVLVVPPVRSSDMQTVEPIFADKVLYVNPDPAVGSDTTGNGTAAAPYETISKAVAESPTKTVVKIVCAEGTYAKAGDLTSVQSHWTRVYIPTDKKIFLKGAGVGKSIIKGVAVEGGTWGGCGENAAKCLVVDGSACGVQGFTLQDGFAYGTDANEAKNQGGAIRAHIGNVENVIVSDVLIDNSGARSGAVFGGNYERCEFTRCIAPYAIVREAGFVASCFLHGNDSSQYGALFYEYPVYDTTVIASTSQVPFPSGQRCYNSVCHGGAYLGTPKFAEEGFPGCVAFNFSSYKVTPEEAFYTKADPRFAVAASSGDGDGRLLPESPAFGTAGVKLEDADTWITNYHRYVTADLKGFPRQFVNGRSVPGAFAWPVAKVTVPEPIVGSETSTGDHYLYRGEAISVEYTPETDPAKARKYLGIWVDDEPVSEGFAYTLSDVEPGRNYVFGAMISTNWYVNANAPNDEGDGFTPETAKRTLRAIMEDVYMLPGDCVHAAEGDYNEGMMFPQNGTAWSGLQLTSNRVVVAADISLVADGAKERTIIRGIKGNVSTGCGPGALRCAYMYPNSLLKGFTLADGATATHAAPSGSSNDDYSGGGVLTYGVDATAYVEDCTFDNCSARNGGGAFGGYLVNCRFTGCRAAASGGALRNCWRLYGCIVESGSVNGPYGVDSCTFGPDSTLEYGNSSGSYVLKNSLVLGTLTVNSSYKFKVSNSLFVEGCGISKAVEAGYATLDKPGADIVLPAERLAVDADYMPAKGSAPVDAGVNAEIPTQLHGRDALGHQRIWNGTVDIGAVERDWRPDYAVALGGTGMTVTEASPSVKLENGKVCLVDGSDLKVTWEGPRAGSRRKYTALVSGAGELDVALADEPLATVTVVDSGVQKYRAPGKTDELEFAYEGAGSALLDEFLCNPGLAVLIR